MNALHAFKADKAITMVLESAFCAVPGTCVLSREAEEKNGDTGMGIFSYLTNSSKALGDVEDSLHSDISGGEDGAICASGCTDVYITAIDTLKRRLAADDGMGRADRVCWAGHVRAASAQAV